MITSITYPIPYVLYAELVDLDQDQQKEIIAVLDPEAVSNRRELGVWKLTKGAWTLVDKVKLPATREGWLWPPAIAKILPTAHGAEIDLDYGEGGTFKCLYLQGKLTCAEPKDH